MIAAGKRWIQYKSRSDCIKLWSMADWHLGNRNCALEELKADIAEIKSDPFSFWIGTGDYADYIGPGDKRFDPSSLSTDISVADLGSLGKVLTSQVRELMIPVKDKCLGLGQGNHEMKYEANKDQQFLHAWLCTELCVPDLGYSFFLDLCFVRQPSLSGQPRLFFKHDGKRLRGDHWQVRIFGHHGSGFAQTPGGKLNKLIQAMDYFESDLTVLSHVHKQSGERLVRLGADRTCKKIIAREQVGTITGTYLKTYQDGHAGYGEQKMYRPVPIGATVTEIWPGKKTVKVST